MKTLNRLVAAAALALFAGPAMAGGPHLYKYEGTFEDAKFALETAIMAKGLVIDSVSHVGDMLARTGRDVGSSVKLFDAADVYLFCSAKVSREVMEADWTNIAYCPYGIFVADRGGEVTIGYQDYPPGAMDKVTAFLDEIVQDALLD